MVAQPTRNPEVKDSSPAAGTGKEEGEIQGNDTEHNSIKNMTLDITTFSINIMTLSITV